MGFLKESMKHSDDPALAEELSSHGLRTTRQRLALLRLLRRRLID